MENGEYELIDVPVYVHSQLYPCCDAPYETLIYTIHVGIAVNVS